MNGLLSTLIAAAQGQTPAVEPRPHGRYEQTGADGRDIEWRMEETGSDPVTPVAPTAPKAESPMATAIPARPPAPRSPEIPPPTQSATSLKPRLPAEDDRTASGHGPADGQGDTTHGGAIAERAPSAPARFAEPLQTTSASRIEPLLPLRQQAPVIGPAAPHTATESREQDAAVEASADGPTLRIGRIEVRTPPPAATPAPLAPRMVASRSVSLPRATVRQSLDDYRTGRKR